MRPVRRSWRLTDAGERDSPPRPLPIRLAGALMAVLCGLLVVPAGFAALMTVFMFDAPGSAWPFALLLAAGFWAAPLVLLLAAVRGVAAARFGRARDLARGGLSVIGLIAWIAFALWLLHAACGYLGCPE